MQEVTSILDHREIVPLAGMLVGVIAILGGVAVVATKIISSHHRRTLLDEMDATLKMEMIKRGMSAAEITQVLEAQTGARHSLRFNRNAAGPWTDEEQGNEVTRNDPTLQHG